MLCVSSSWYPVPLPVFFCFQVVGVTRGGKTRLKGGFNRCRGVWHHIRRVVESDRGGRIDMRRCRWYPILAFFLLYLSWRPRLTLLSLLLAPRSHRCAKTYSDGLVVNWSTGAKH